MAPQHTTVAIIGTGFAGLGAAIKLQEAGIDDFILLEAADEVGGTWRDNTYPGAACDVASHLYSFSFELNPDWSHAFAGHAEIQAYILRVVRKYALRPKIWFDAAVVEQRFDETTARWHLKTADRRELVTRFVINGVGALRDVRYPAIEGRERFEGPSMHSARWDHSVNLHGKRVGIIGTGASAIQIVPALAGHTQHITLFQRTPSWIVARNDGPISAARRAAFRTVPGLMRAARLKLYAQYESRFPLVSSSNALLTRLATQRVAAHLHAQVSDPLLREKLRPDYRPGCKRILLSDDFYPALMRDDVQLETRTVDAIEPDGVRLSDGEHLALDALIYCTGFIVDKPLGAMRVLGVGGRDLAEWWGTRPRAYLGLSIPGFPNHFTMLGPNTALGHNSVIVMIEAGIRYTVQAIAHTLAQGPRAHLDLKPEVLDAFVAEVDAKHATLSWASGCDSWYLGRDGVNFTIWPYSTLAYMARTRRFNPHLYTLSAE